MQVLPVDGQSARPQTLKEVLLGWLHSTHDREDWFVPVNIAVEAADDGKIKASASRIAHIGTHNAYHVG